MKKSQPFIRIIYNTLFFLLAINFVSCVTPRVAIPIDILRPANVTFKKQANNVLIINNSVQQADNVGHFDSDKVQKDMTLESESLKFDSAAVFCNASLQETLAAYDFFSAVKVSHVKQNKSNNSYNIIPLSSTQKKLLYEIYDADAIIALEKISTVDIIGSYQNEDYDSYAALDVEVTTIWSIHYPTSDTTKYYQFEDKFSWEEESRKKLPARYDALVDACILTGSNVAQRLIPQWETQERYFFVPRNKNMKMALDYVNSQRWSEAISIWQNEIENSSSARKKFQLSINKAYAYEISGNIDDAIKSLKDAIKIYPSIVIITDDSYNDIMDAANYLQYLNKRKSEIELINKQLGE